MLINERKTFKIFIVIPHKKNCSFFTKYSILRFLSLRSQFHEKRLIPSAACLNISEETILFVYNRSF